MDYNIFENFERTRLLAGDSMMKALADTRVLIFGVGGVGSWCAESLARTGIGSITMVDPDTVAQSNINRQLPATTGTVGLPKVEVLADRLASINRRRVSRAWPDDTRLRTRPDSASKATTT